MSQEKPQYVIIIGAMKAGTSALFSALATHPDILGSTDKEPGFWIKDGAHEAGEQAYLNWWNRAAKPDATWLLEGSTHYTKLPSLRSAAVPLKVLRGRCRFIYLTRDPVQRVRSHYEMALAYGWESRPIHEELGPHPVWYSNYYMQIRPYVDVFGKEAICALSYEELKSDPTAVLRRVAAFLDVDPGGFPPALPRVNVASEHRRLRLDALRARLGDRVGDYSEEQLHAHLTAEVTPTEVHIARLHEELDRDLAEFERLFGIDPWTGQRHEARPATIQHPAAGSMDSALRAIEEIRRASSPTALAG